MKEWKTQLEKGLKTCHRGWLYTPFRVLFCKLFYFIHCCRFAIIESLPFELVFIFLWHRKACTVYVRTTHFMAHTIWSTLRMQLYILFFLSHCFDFSFFLLLLLHLLIHIALFFHPISIYVAFFMLATWKTSLFLWCFSCLWFANTRKRMKKKHYGGKQENVANSPWYFSPFKWNLMKKMKPEEEFKWKSVFHTLWENGSPS